MTVWEWLVSNSSLAEADGDAWEHLTHPSSVGGASVQIGEAVPIKISAIENTIKLADGAEAFKIAEEDTTDVLAMVDNSDIIEQKEDKINGLC